MDQAKKLRELMNEEVSPIEIEKSANIIAVSSGKGGVGKSNFSVNFALNLIKKGHKVAILDADVGLGNIEILLGLEIKNTISDLIVGDKDIEEVLATGPMDLKIISGGKGLQELDNMTEENILKVLEALNQLQRLVDYIIIDTGAGISSVVINFILAAEEVIIVTTPDPTSVMDSYVLIKSLSMKNYTGNVNIVTNMTTSTKDGILTFDKINRASNNFLSMKTKYLGYISKDEKVNKSVRNQIPFTISYPTSKVVKEFEDISSRFLTGDKYRMEDESFGTKLLNIFKKRWQNG